jgi:hypothetical protein
MQTHDKISFEIVAHQPTQTLTLGVGVAPNVQLNATLTRPELVTLINSLIAALKSIDTPTPVLPTTPAK